MNNEISITLLGTGCPTLHSKRFGPATLIRDSSTKIIFDTGSGVTQRLTQVQEKVSDIDAVFITHMHSDHIVDLYQLFISGWHQGRENSLLVYGPPELDEFIERTQSMWKKEQDLRKSWERRNNESGLSWEVKIIEGSEKIQVGNFEVEPFLVDHFPIEPAFGYKISNAQKNIVISGDTGPSENLILNSKGSDLLIHELFTEQNGDYTIGDSVYQKTPSSYHTTPSQVGIVAQKAGTKHLLLTHFVPPEFNQEEAMKEIREHYKGEITFGNDLYNIVV